MTTVASLGELTNIVSGFAFPSKNFTDGQGTPVIRIRDVLPGRTSLRYKGEYDPKFLARDGDLLITMDGEFRVAEWSGGEALINQRVCKIEPANSDLDQRFLLHFLPRKLKLIEDQTPYVTVKHLSAKKIREISLSLPPLDEQRRIAAILDKADAIRRKREQALALADDLLKSTFLEMFGDPATNPKEWPTATLDDLGDVQGGLQVSRKRDANELKLPYLRVANVFRDRLELDEIKMIGLTSKEQERVALRKGDVLIVEGHGNPDEIGRSAVWDGSIEDCVHQNHLIRFRPTPGKLDPEYASRLLNSTGGRLQLVAAGRTTSGLNTISTSKVKAVTIPVPPIELQIRFHKFCDQVIALKSKFWVAGDLGNDLFASLSQRAFRGEL